MIDGYSVFDSHMHYSGTFLPKGQSFIEYMDANGIDAAIVNTLNKNASFSESKNTSPADFITKLKNPDFNPFDDLRFKGQPDHKEVIELAKKYPDRIYPFFWYNPVDEKDPQQEKGLEIARNALNNGFFGIKLQMAMTPCEKIEQLYPIANVADEFNKPLYIHPTPIPPRTDPFELIKLCKKFPNLKIILGHAAYYMDFCVELFFAAINMPNLFFETSCSAPYGIIALTKLFGARRVLFGSDAPTAGPFNLEYEKIKLIKISDNKKQRILGRNIERMLKK